MEYDSQRWVAPHNTSHVVGRAAGRCCGVADLLWLCLVTVWLYRQGHRCQQAGGAVEGLQEHWLCCACGVV